MKPGDRIAVIKFLDDDDCCIYEIPIHEVPIAILRTLQKTKRLHVQVYNDDGYVQMGKIFDHPPKIETRPDHTDLSHAVREEARLLFKQKQLFIDDKVLSTPLVEPDPLAHITDPDTWWLPKDKAVCICQITAFGRVDNPKCPECHPDVL
jgi:hypothetical protein